MAGPQPRVHSERPLRRLVSAALFLVLLFLVGATVALTTSRDFWVMVNLWAQSSAGEASRTPNQDGLAMWLYAPTAA